MRHTYPLTSQFSRTMPFEILSPWETKAGKDLDKMNRAESNFRLCLRSWSCRKSKSRFKLDLALTWRSHDRGSRVDETIQCMGAASAAPPPLSVPTIWRVRTSLLNQVTNNTYNLIERKTISLMPHDHSTWQWWPRAGRLSNELSATTQPSQWRPVLVNRVSFG